MNFGQLASKMTPKGWAMAGGAAAAAIVFLVLIMNFASKPSYSTLMTGVDPTQTGKITSTLSTKGIAYQIQNNGTAIAVQSDKTGDARIALATAGLLNGTSQPGFELFDKQQLGASNFQQQITYQRALEGQLGAGAARAAQPPGPALLRQLAVVQRGGAAVGLRHARPQLRQGHRAARRLQRSGSAAQQGHDHRLLRHAAVAQLRRLGS